MEDLEKELEKSVWEIIIDLQREIRELEEENKTLREENEMLRCNKGWTPEKVWHEEFIQYLMEENKKLKDELELKNLALKQAQEWSILI